MIVITKTALNKTKSLIVEIIAALFILLFVYAATSKLMDHQSFLHAIQNSPLLKPVAAVISWFIPFTEITISMSLFSSKFRNAGLLYSMLLMSVFTLYLIYMLLFIPHLPCSCGGVLSGLTWGQHLAFNAVFTLLGLFGWIISKTNKNFIAINRLS